MNEVRASNLAVSSQICFVFDEVRTSHPEFFGCLSGWQWLESLRPKLLRAGIQPDSVAVYRLGDSIPPHNLIVGFGEKTLQHFTGKRGIDKWQLSPLRTLDGRKFIPTFDMGRVQKQFELNLYQELALRRAASEVEAQDYNIAPERFFLNPALDETLAVLTALVEKPEISVDVETGWGQINTVGFAWSPSDAIAINVLPDRLNDEDYYRLWDAIRAVLEGPARKIFQNYIYDTSYFNAYGIQVVNTSWDTMHAMKVLHPELDMNLGNVGRLYTNRPYWKDDGKVEHEEGKKKDWGNVRNWHRHYLYNCRDSSGTWEAKQNQEVDMRERNLYDYFTGYIMRLQEPVLEMCTNGIPLCEKTRESIRLETQTKIATLTEQFKLEVGVDLNPRSPKQVKTYLKGKGIKLPKKFNKTKGSYEESTDASSLQKVLLKNPEFKELKTLAEIKSLDTALSRYVDFISKPGDERLRYSLNMTGTETLRFSGGKDPWGCGVNIQTLPHGDGDGPSIKSMFRLYDKTSFLEVDLRQAESKYVAYAAVCKKLMDMLESGEDVHTFVAHEILKKLGRDASAIPKAEFKKTWRQLGKKGGHSANYDVQANMFMEICFSEMGIVLTKFEAQTILETYHGIFPEIRQNYHRGVVQELRMHRRLRTPDGWERYFYGRFDRDMMKEAYAHAPQHMIPYITNRMMLYLHEERKRGNLRFDFLVQVHDALYMRVPDEGLESVARICGTPHLWHPKIELPGGILTLGTEVKTGKSLDQMQEWKV